MIYLLFIYTFWYIETHSRLKIFRIRGLTCAWNFLGFSDWAGMHFFKLSFTNHSSPNSYHENKQHWLPWQWLFMIAKGKQYLDFFPSFHSSLLKHFWYSIANWKQQFGVKKSRVTSNCAFSSIRSLHLLIGLWSGTSSWCLSNEIWFLLRFSANQKSLSLQSS